MGEDYTREEHIEFVKRMEDEHKRLNRRLELLEEDVKQIGDLTASVKQLAVNMENMLHIQEEQAGRLKALEGRDGEKWRTVTGYIVTTVIGIIVGFIFKQLGF